MCTIHFNETIVLCPDLGLVDHSEIGTNSVERARLSSFYQPAAREARSRLVLRLLCCFRVCISVRPHLSRAQ